MMTSYLDTYIQRVNNLGKTHKEREYNAGIRDFEKYKNQSPASDDIELDGIPTRAVILSNRQDENKLTKKVSVSLSDNLHPGSLIKWGEEYWIVYQRERDPNQTEWTGSMVRCNYYIRWVNSYGVVKESWAYIKGAMDSIIKMNFRTWHALITPQPNQFLEMILPNVQFDLGQRILISDRAWFIAEYDNTSADGIIYVSMTETKRDTLDDDISAELADANRVNSWTIQFAMNEINCDIGSSYVVQPQIYYQGTLQDVPIIAELEDTTIADIMVNEDNTIAITGKAEGATTLTVSIKKEPQVKGVLPVVIDAQSVNTLYIYGDDSIRMGQTSIYEVLYTLANESVTIISVILDNTDLATAIIKDNKIIVSANVKNQRGNIVMTVETDKGQLIKNISIVSIW